MIKTPTITACTIATPNCIAQARVLATSFREHHPTSAFTLLLLDRFSCDEGAADVLSLNDLGLPVADLHRLPKIYASAELALGLKPWLLRHELSRYGGGVIYLDPSVYVAASLQRVADLLRNAEVVLAVRSPFAEQAGVIADEAERFRHEPGFVAVGENSGAFLEWWMSRVREDFDAARSVDRCLLDKIPPAVRSCVINETGWNVGYWNLPERKLTATRSSYDVDGEPLRFFNFSGYEPGKPHLLSKHQGHYPRVLLSEQPAVAKLAREYAANLRAAAVQGQKENPNGLGVLPSGTIIDRHMHALYTKATERFAAGAGPQPPNLLTADGEVIFTKWLNQRMFDGQPEITRYMFAVHAGRPDLQEAFPEPLGTHAIAFHDWFLDCGRVEENVPPELMPTDAPAGVVEASSTSDHPKEIEPPVNIVGYFRAELGNGETARWLVSAFEAARIPFTTTLYDDTTSRQAHEFELRKFGPDESDVQLICINADRLPAFVAQRSDRSTQRRYTIGLWFWEVDKFPAEFDAAFDLVDEVWVASEFIEASVRKVSPKAVFRIVLPVVTPQVDHQLDRAAGGLPDRFCFLFSFDFLSVLERKNAVGLIDAFARAFQPNEGPLLVIKSINGDQRVLDLERLKFAANDRADIRLMDGYLSAADKNALMATCDCYVSLHRAEGFGQTLAEAMALGKPAIATNYSGNLDFMTPENSYLCSYVETEVGPGNEPYPPHAHWAKPNLDEAAALMRHVYNNPDEARARGARATGDLRMSHSPAVAGRIISDRLEVIRRHLRRRNPTASAGEQVIAIDSDAGARSRSEPDTVLPPGRST